MPIILALKTMEMGTENSVGKPELHSNLQTNFVYIVTVKKGRKEKNKETKIHISYLSTNIIFLLLKPIAEYCFEQKVHLSTNRNFTAARIPPKISRMSGCR